MHNNKFLTLVLLFACSSAIHSHGTSISPMSRVYRIFQSNPENPSFQLARDATAIDGKNSYYTWNQVSRNIPEAVVTGLPEGFDYSPWLIDGQIASGGRVSQDDFPGLTHAGLDQVSADWPTTDVTAGETVPIDFLTTASHEPSVWDVWMTTEDWDPTTTLNWDQMEFIGRPTATLQGNHYYFDVDIPEDRSGHHVLWIAWHRDDPVGEVFFSTSDLMVAGLSTPCVDSLNIAMVDQLEYHASQVITSNATISSPIIVDFKAGSLLLLMPLFQLNSGAELAMYIEDCL